jgi:hypothetical protein
MRYRLTIVIVILATSGVAAAVLTLTTGENPSIERDQGQTDIFSPGLGIMAAFTATAKAGGATLDPTALVTPTIDSAAVSTVGAVVSDTAVP